MSRAQSLLVVVLQVSADPNVTHIPVSEAVAGVRDPPERDAIISEQTDLSREGW